MIDGVGVRPLRQIMDERGKVMHMLRRDEPWFRSFGEIYFSVVNPGVVKGWHLHKTMWLNYAVVHGRITMALYDERRDSPTRGQVQEIGLGGADYFLVTVPPGIWNGFKGEGSEPSIVANCASEPHDPGEISRMDPFKNEIPYHWGGAVRGG